MFAKNLILITLFGIASLLHANVSTNFPSNDLSASYQEGPCDIPAPSNFHVENIGSTWVDLTWIPSNLADAHRIKTYETVSGILVSNILVPPGNLVQKVNGLQPNMAYYSRINAVCANGYDSEEYVQADYLTIIVDLIVIGRESSATVEDCIIDAIEESCPFPVDGSMTAFMFKSELNPFKFRKFFVDWNPVTTHFGVKLKKDNTNETFVFQCDNQDPNCSGQSFQVKTLGGEIAAFEIVYQPGQSLGWLTCTSIADHYRFVQLDPGPQQNGPSGGPMNGKHSVAGDLQESLQVQCSPNPFADNLSIYLENAGAKQVNLQLFDLGGQKVLEQQHNDGDSAMELNTKTLPSGFYLLRVESGDEVQTLKVVKAR